MRNLKNFLILPKFQSKLIAASVIPILFTFGVIFFQFKNSFAKLERHMDILGLSHNPQVVNAVQAQEILMSRYFLIGSAIGIILSLIFLIFVSHKLAGPVYRLKKELKQGRQSGKMQKLVFRDGDYLKDLEDDLNYFMVHEEEEKKAS